MKARSSFLQAQPCDLGCRHLVSAIILLGSTNIKQTNYTAGIERNTLRIQSEPGYTGT